jgi:hypothetical protein
MRPCEICWFASGVSAGIFRTNETISQIAASSRDLPHAGIALILMPCLIVQNARWASRLPSCVLLLQTFLANLTGSVRQPSCH